MPQHATKMLWTCLSTAFFSTSRVCFIENVLHLSYLIHAISLARIGKVKTITDSINDNYLIWSELP